MSRTTQGIWGAACAAAACASSGAGAMRSSSGPQLSSIELIFKLGTNLLHARQLVQERMATVLPTLPTWAAPPDVRTAPDRLRGRAG